MLLARLVEYASDAAREGGVVPPPYYKAQLIRWILELNDDGSLASRELQPLASPDDPVHRNGVEYVVPSITKTSGIAPQIAVGTPEYMFGWVADDGKPDRVHRAHEAFCGLTADWAAADPSGPATALHSFLAGEGLQQLARPGKWGRGDLSCFRVSR